MNVAKIRRDSPEQVFVTVRNGYTSAMSVGHAVHWNFPITDAGTGTGDGYSVTYAAVTTATSQMPPWAFAGIVAGKDIPAGEYGSCQVYGYHTGVCVTGGGHTTPTPFLSGIFTISTHTAGVFSNLLLKPLYAFGYTSGTGVGCLAPVVQNSTAATNAHNPGLHPGGYVIPLGNINGGATMASNSSASVKAFIRCM